MINKMIEKIKARNTDNNIMILVTVLIMDLLAGMEFDIFVPSFPELQTQFNLSSFSVEALLSVNFIGFCISLFIVGALSDHYGRKPIILIGLMLFILGSMLCIFEINFLFLLIGRFMQGLGIAAPAILSFLIIADSYPMKQQQFFMAILNGIMNAATGAAPVIGSYIALYFHWQGNFITLLLIGMLTFLMVMLFIPQNKPQATKLPFSWRAYKPLFESKPLLILMFFFIMNFIPYWVFVGMSPLLYLKDLHVSLAHFGYYQGTLALIFGVGSILFGFLLNKFSQKKMLYVANVIFIFGLLCMTYISIENSHNPLIITLCFIPFIVGQIIPGAILSPICLNFIPEAKGRASALMQASRLIICSISLQFAGYFYTGSFQNIGIILSIFILMTVLMFFCVLGNKPLMQKID
jgi:DHA1 family bicyclomycin/chloramphenicol resistance-like MFS transporter